MMANALPAPPYAMMTESTSAESSYPQAMSAHQQTLPQYQHNLDAIDSSLEHATMNLPTEAQNNQAPSPRDNNTPQQANRKNRKIENDTEWENVPALTNENGLMYCIHPKGGINVCVNFATADRDEWNKHHNAHTRPFTCPEPSCASLRGFTYSGGLLRHQREVHRKFGGPKEMLNCPYPYCKRNTGTPFTRKENLNEHIRRVHKPAKDYEGAGDGQEQGRDEESMIAEAQMGQNQQQQEAMQGLNVAPFPPRLQPPKSYKRKRENPDHSGSPQPMQAPAVPMTPKELALQTQLDHLKGQYTDALRHATDMRSLLDDRDRQISQLQHDCSLLQQENELLRGGGPGRDGSVGMLDGGLQGGGGAQAENEMRTADGFEEFQRQALETLGSIHALTGSQR